MAEKPKRTPAVMLSSWIDAKVEDYLAEGGDREELLRVAARFVVASYVTLSPMRMVAIKSGPVPAELFEVLMQAYADLQLGPKVTPGTGKVPLTPGDEPG